MNNPGTSFWSFCVFVFRRADTLSIRLLLANASILYVLFLMIDPGAFNRHGYQVMSSFGPPWAWSLAFLLHGAGVYWRIAAAYCRWPERPHWALAINTLGLSVWLLSTLSTNLAIGHIMPSTAMEWTICAFSGWALYRTGTTEELLPA